MLFSSITFVYYFLPIVIMVYYITPKKYRNAVLLIFSLIFYFYGEHRPVLLFACLLNFFFGIIIENKKSKTWLSIGILANVLMLVYYKYMDFFISNFNSLFSTEVSLFNLILPLGISFFTFQNISYLVDVYKSEVCAQKNIIKYATYITFFPQLIAGPIVRYKDVNEDLESRKESFEKFSYGVKRFIIGLSKKVIISNNIGAMIVSLNLIGSKSVLTYMLIAIGYTLQIYFDFSGYSDMAVGLGSIFGFKIKENFNYPLIASSITDFWRRWHMSLSSFFKDYVYIPLGGNRVSKIKLVRNILVVWLLTGFWHGASWNFIIWGIYFCIFLMLEKFVIGKYLKGGIISHIYTLIVVIISFIIFNIEKLNDIFVFIKSLIGFNNLPFSNFETVYYLKNYLIIIIISIFAATPILKVINKKIKKRKIVDICIPIILCGLLIICTASLVSSSFNPFIYFRF